MLESLKRPIVFAHRGASADAPENTLAAFRMAEAAGADGIELDAKLSADGRVVVFHDATLERTTNGVGRLSLRTADELRALDAGGWFSEAYRGEKIPLLDEVFDAVGGRLLINVELANYQTPNDALVSTVCELVERRALQRSVVFSSFMASNLSQAARLLPEVPRGLLARPGWRGAWARSFGFSFGDYAALHPYISDLSPQQVRRVHRLKRRVHVWSANTALDVMRIVDWGVDGMFSRDPKMALETLRSRD